jgi:hypothetical protein
MKKMDHVATFGDQLRLQRAAVLRSEPRCARPPRQSRRVLATGKPMSHEYATVYSRLSRESHDQRSDPSTSGRVCQRDVAKRYGRSTPARSRRSRARCRDRPWDPADALRSRNRADVESCRQSRQEVPQRAAGTGQVDRGKALTRAAVAQPPGRGCHPQRPTS